MATRTVTSNSITFIDTSDERKLEVSVEANLPTSQIYNSNTGAYSPDWTTTNNNLKLEACATLDLIDITQDEGITITWSKKFGTGEAQSAGTGYQLKISTNELSDASGIVTYICTAIYDGLTATSQMTFTRVDTGNNGRGIKSVVNYYLASSLSSGVTRTDTAGWSTQIPTLTETNKYLWNYEEIQYSDNNFDYTEPCIVGNFATNGKAGKGISSIEEYYAISDSNSTSPNDSEFSTTVPTLTSINKYLWNYEKITYTDETNYTSEKRVIGVYGDSAIVYSMSVSTNVISKNTSNQYNPSVIKLEGKQKIGNNLLSNYSGRFKIEETTDMSSWASKYTSSKDESATEYVPSVGIKAIKCSMYQAGESGALLDYQIIPIVSDGSDSYTIILSNESHTFAGSESSAIVSNTTCEVIAYKGTERVAATIGTISGCPTGMTTSISNNSTASANFTVSVDTTMTTKSGMLTIPITVDKKSFTKYFSYSLALKGSDGVNGITFQIYGEQGLVLTKDAPSTVLKVFAYDGGTEITDATYKWYYQNATITNDEGTNITDWIDTNVTTDSLAVDRTQIFGSTSYKCEMTYNGETYYAIAIVQDKNDIYSAFINSFDTVIDINGKHYIVLYSTVYSEDGEVDPLLGPIFNLVPNHSSDSSDSGTVGLYTYIRYADDENGANMSTDSTKPYAGIIYNGEPSNEAQDYIWKKHESGQVPPFYCYTVQEDTYEDLGTVVNICPLQIIQDGGIGLATWDYIEPKNNNSYPSQIYNYYWRSVKSQTPFLNLNKVILVSTDDFADGSSDIICEISDETGVIARASILLKGTLQCQDDMGQIKNTLDKYTQSVTVNSGGITITAVDDNNNESPFSSRFTSSKLAFLYDETKASDSSFEETDPDEALTKLKITANGIYTPNIDVKETIQLGGLKFIIEDNGSYSITV